MRAAGRLFTGPRAVGKTSIQRPVNHDRIASRVRAYVVSFSFHSISDVSRMQKIKVRAMRHLLKSSAFRLLTRLIFDISFATCGSNLNGWDKK